MRNNPVHWRYAIEPRKTTLCAFVALGIGVLTACGDGEAVSAARVKIGASPTTTTTAPETTTAPPIGAAAPKPAAAQPANPATPSRSTTPPPSTKTTAPTPASTVEPVQLTVTANPKLGRILVDGKGRTLYRLDADNVKPVRSTCVDDCAKRFPPLLVPANGTVTAEGVDATLIGRITRPDNTIQVTFGGRPVYRFVGDVAAGDTLGQGNAGGKIVTVS
jgi:predicted lipoprotein with Yx(FWY)xxD motif